MPNLDKVLADLAAKLGVTVDHLWQVMIRQARIEIFTDVFWMVASVAVIWSVYKWTRSYYTRNHELTDGHPGEGIPMVFSWIGAAVMGICFVVALWEIPTLIFNPEYWALHELLGTMK